MEEILKFDKERVVQLRAQLGLSQSEFGKKLGATRQRINNWEEGLAKPNVDTLGKMSTVYRVEAGYFFT